MVCLRVKINAALPFSETILFLAYDVLSCGSNSSEYDPAEDFARERKQWYPPPVIAVPMIAFLWKFDNSASFPPLWGVFSDPYVLKNLTEDLGCHNFLSLQHLWTDPVFTRCLSIFECFDRFSNFSFDDPIEVDINIFFYFLDISCVCWLWSVQDVLKVLFLSLYFLFLI